MPDFTSRNGSELESALWRLFRDYFDKAERRRRWSLRDDIPWGQCNRSLAPVVAYVVESFCAVELYLPDYLARALPRARPSRARAWFYANWGYEESKHSLALGDWLLKSGMRSEEQLADLEGTVFARQWDLPHDNTVAMLAYAMTQELATWLNYRNLRRRVAELGGDPALEKLLTLVAVDERAHHGFFLECVQLYLKQDAEGTLEQLRRVMNHFAMPAIYQLADTRQRVARIKELGIFDDDLYYREVYLPILAALGVTRQEMRNRLPRRKTLTVESEQ